jgi:hypothetical protein
MKRWMVASLLSLVFASGSVHAAEKSGDKPSSPESRDSTVGKPATVRDATVEDVKAFFERENRKVLTFVGYSGAGYEHEASMLKQAERVLLEFDPTRTIVNGGATSEGIGDV